MSPVQFLARSPRLLPEIGSQAAVELAAPPSPPEPDRGWMAALLPALGALGMLGFALLSPNVWIIALCGGVAIVSAGAAVWSSRQQKRRSRDLWAARRERYLAHLRECVITLIDAARRQREYAFAAHPSLRPAAPPAEDELWIKRRVHEDFLHVRLGLGRLPARRPPRLMGASGDSDGDRDLLDAANEIVARHSSLDDLPITLDLTSAAHDVVSFDRLAHLRAAIISLAMSHGPDVLRIEALVGAAEAGWLRALPQTGAVGTTADASTSDEESPATAEWIAGLQRELRRESSNGASASQCGSSPRSLSPYRIVVLAGSEPSTRSALSALADQLGTAESGLGVLLLLPAGAPLPDRVTIEFKGNPDGGCVLTRRGDHPELTAVPQPDSLSHFEACRLARSLAGFGLATAGPRRGGKKLLLSDLLDGIPADPLSLPIGQDDDGLPITIDLREAARGGDGPHGLVIGATGSGKSELLRTLLLAAAYQSPPEALTFLLVDFKGGAAFTDIARLPHTAGLVTNLNADALEIDRLCASLRAELRRRQRLLRDAGVDDIDSYASSSDVANTRAPEDFARLPRLLVVVDEYAELIEESPEVLDVLMSIGRLGRSLGIHLLLASQRLDDGRLRGLDAHLRFRVCLRTTSSAESVSVIGAGYAAQLPSDPGWGWLRRDGSLQKLKVALAGDSRAYVRTVAARHSGSSAAASTVTRAICLPPLPDEVTLDSLAATAEAAPWSAPVGVVDLPELGRQDAMTFDLTAAAGHLVVVGAPRSGRSTALATLVAALADSTPPRDLAIHVVTSPASILVATSGLPHVGTVATSGELAARVIRAVADEVEQRQQQASHEQDAQTRTLLVVDDLSAALRFHDGIASQLARIANVGLSVGVSLAVSCGAWTQLRGGLREAIGTSWELKLNDASDSEHPQLTRRVTRSIPGRVMTNDGKWAQLALPRIDGHASIERLPSALSELVSTIARRGGSATRPVRVLPTRVPAELLREGGDPSRVAIGVAGTYADTVELDVSPGRHFVVLGNSGSGRSGLLRAIAASVVRSGSGVWLIDPRRSLGLLGPTGSRRASTADDVARLIETLATRLAGDRAPDLVEPAAVERCVLIVDDLDLAAGPGRSSAFAPLVDLLPFAGDLGLSVVVARRVSGSSRAAFDPFYGRLLELSDTSLLLSGDPSEGPVVGGLRPHFRAPGRGELIRHGTPVGDIQAAWLGEFVQMPHAARNGANTDGYSSGKQM